MTVEDPTTVDVIGIEPQSGKVVLTLADHLDWEAESAHELTLQAKLETYLAFIDSGEITESYPKAAGRALVIDIVLRVEPTPRGQEFLSRIREPIEGMGIELRVRVRPD